MQKYATIDLDRKNTKMSVDIHTALPTGERGERPEASDMQGRFSAGALARVMRSRPNGVSGPEARDAQNLISAKEIADRMERDLSEADMSIVAQVSSQVNKLASRDSQVAQRGLSSDFSAEMARRLDSLLHQTDGFRTQQGSKAVVRLALNAPDVGYIDDYLGGTLTEELSRYYGNAPAFASAASEFMTKAERLRRASLTRTPYEDTLLSVKHAWEIAADRQKFFEGQGVVVSPAFLDALTDKALLMITTRTPDNYDAALRLYADIFSRCEQDFPLFMAADKWAALGFMIRGGVATDYEKVAEKIRPAEEKLRSLEASGEMNSATSKAVTRTGAEGDVVGRADALRVRSDAYNPGPVGERTRAAAVRGNLSPGDYSALRYGNGREYRDVLFDIDESPKITDQEKQDIYEAVRETRQLAAAFIDQFATVDETVAEAAKYGVNQRLTEVLYAAKFLAEHAGETVVVPMGSRDVTFEPTKTEYLRALSVLRQGFATLAKMRFSAAGRSTEHTLDLRHVAAGDKDVLLLTKLYREPIVAGVERGASARASFSVGIDGTPSSLVSDREQDSLGIRFDIVDGHRIQLDIGGKTDAFDTPDFTVARMLSLGAWYRAQLRGTEAGDYHVDIAQTTPDRFADFVSSIRESNPALATTMKIPRS